MPKAKAKKTTVSVSLSRPSFAFDLRQVVAIDESGETGTIQARAEYVASENSYYLVRYRQANGVDTEAWWQESALSAA